MWVVVVLGRAEANAGASAKRNAIEIFSFMRQPFYAYIGRVENPSGFIFPLPVNTKAGP
jgi:hypothetical protein